MDAPVHICGGVHLFRVFTSEDKQKKIRLVFSFRPSAEGAGWWTLCEYPRTAAFVPAECKEFEGDVYCHDFEEDMAEKIFQILMGMYGTALSPENVGENTPDGLYWCRRECRV